VLQRGGRGVRRGRARRLRPDRGRPLLLRQRKTCRRASRRQGAARAGRRDCAAAAVAQQRATWAAAGGAAAPAASAGSAACAGAKPCAVMATGARATAGTPTSAAPCARRGSDSYRTPRASQSMAARRRGRRRVGLRKLWVTGSGRLSKIATGRRFPTAPPHVMCAPARPRGLPRGSACRRPGGAALPAQSQAQRRAAPTRGRARGGRKHARPPGDANPRQAPRERRRPPA